MDIASWLLIAAVVGFTLTAAGYVSTTQGNLVQQSESTVRALYLCIGVIPACIFLVGVVLILFYNLDQAMLQKALPVEAMSGLALRLARPK